jgi:hypothetical protein
MFRWNRESLPERGGHCMDNLTSNYNVVGTMRSVFLPFYFILCLLGSLKMLSYAPLCFLRLLILTTSPGWMLFFYWSLAYPFLITLSLIAHHVHYWVPHICWQQDRSHLCISPIWVFQRDWQLNTWGWCRTHDCESNVNTQSRFEHLGDKKILL